MIRLTTKTAAGAVAAAAVIGALAACTPMKMGAAAIVGDDRITTSSLDRTVRDWREEFDRDPAAEQIQARGRGQGIPFDFDSPERSALFQLIDFRIWRQVAGREGVDVTRGQIDSLLATAGGAAQLKSTVLAFGLPSDRANDFARVQIVQESMLRKYGVTAPTIQPTDPAVQQAVPQVRGVYIDTARKMKIKINPRFGTFQAGQGADGRPVTIAPVGYKLSATESGTR